MTRNSDIVFISCGQQTERERLLGKEIQALVRELTPFQPYYAEYQSSLEGLTKNIFAALHRCVGLIAVMHHRGRIDPPGSRIRASVWVEQEIAIAAFIRAILGKNIEVAAFIEQGIMLEGVRKQLLLNPKKFTENGDVIGHLRLILPSWKAPETVPDARNLDITLDYEKKNITQNRHDYLLVVLLTNKGNQPVDDWHVDVEFPTAILEHPEKEPYFVGSRSTKTHSFFRIRQFDHGTKIFPGDSLRAITIKYFMDNDTFARKGDLFQKTVRATLYSNGMEPKIVEKSVLQLQIF
ncbi:MAG: hypothetical protein NT022_00620 [Deltaproteobacteria bacterium]|nr:hypothetical protein [Deltaproteobacteria bacterium]